VSILRQLTALDDHAARDAGDGNYTQSAHAEEEAEDVEEEEEEEEELSEAKCEEIAEEIALLSSPDAEQAGWAMHTDADGPSSAVRPPSASAAPARRGIDDVRRRWQRELHRTIPMVSVPTGR
jgi:hypothetical protein